MKTKLLLALAAGIIALAGNVNAALTFNWSFTGNSMDFNTYSSLGAGTVQGTLTLNGSGAASSLFVTQITGSNASFSNNNLALNALANQFTVSNVAGVDVITSASFFSGSGVGGLALNHFDGAQYYSTSFMDTNYVGVFVANSPNTPTFSAITFTPAAAGGGGGTSAVPEASTSLGLLALGAGGVLTRRRFKRKA